MSPVRHVECKMIREGASVTGQKAGQTVWSKVLRLSGACFQGQGVCVQRAKTGIDIHGAVYEYGIRLYTVKITCVHACRLRIHCYSAEAVRLVHEVL